MTTSLWHRSGDTQLRKTVFAVANGASVEFFVGGTSTPLVVFNDADESSPAGSEVAADAQGRWPNIYVPTGNSFDYYIRDVDGTLITFAADVPNPTVNAVTPPTPGAYETGDILFGLKAGARSGWVRLNGRTIGGTSSAATERANDDTEDLFEYMWNELSDTLAPVSGGRGASPAADFAANKTITLPDGRGAGLFGVDGMGSTDAERLGNVPFSIGDTLTPGSVGGTNSTNITASQMPVHRHGSGTLSVTTTDHTHGFGPDTTSSSGSHSHTSSTGSAGTHQHTVSKYQGLTNVGSDGATISSIWQFDNGAALTSSAGDHSHSISADGTHTHTVSGTTASGGGQTISVLNETADTGSGDVFNMVARSILGTWYIKL